MTLQQYENLKIGDRVVTTTTKVFGERRYNIPLVGAVTGLWKGFGLTIKADDNSKYMRGFIVVEKI